MAVAAAKDLQFRLGSRVEDLWRQTRLEAVGESVGGAAPWLFFRALRLAIAIGLALFIPSLAAGVRRIVDRTIDKLTPSMIVSAGFHALLAIGISLLCIWLAFGRSGA